MVLEFFKFPTGEVHFMGKIDKNLLYVPYKREVTINDWIMQIMLASSSRPGLELFIPYLPYSRQDRPTSNQEPFSLKVLGQILNTGKFKKVYTLDAHSDVAYGCIDNLTSIPISFILGEMYTHDYFNDQVLIIPDQGAYKKLNKCSHMFSSVATAIKERDTATGHLTLKHLIGDVEGKYCSIIDDICDGGGTFTALAKELKARGAKIIDLHVTHGIFTKGAKVLFDSGISMVHTTNSFPQDWAYPVDSVDCLDILERFKKSER